MDFFVVKNPPKKNPVSFKKKHSGQSLIMQIRHICLSGFIHLPFNRKVIVNIRAYNIEYLKFCPKKENFLNPNDMPQNG